MGLLDSAFKSMFTPGEKRANPSVLNDYSSLFSSFGSGFTGTASLNYKQSLKISAVYNAIELISNDIAKIPFAVFESTNGNKTRLKWHKTDILLSREPNFLMTPFVFKKLIGVSLKLRGNALFKIYFDKSGYAESVEYINWDAVMDIRRKDGDLLYYIRGLDKPLLSSEVLHFKQFSLNGIVGVSTISYAAMQLNVAIKTQEFSATIVESKGVRHGIISTEKTLGGKDNQAADVKKSIREGWRAAMAERSPDRVVVLDEGMTFTPITITPQELQIIEQQRFNVEDIARWFNIAPHKIKSLQQSTNNNIEQQSLDHISDTIQPDITNIEQEFAKKLLSLSERESRYIKGNLNILLRADMAARGEFYSKMVQAGVYSRNEVRSLEDMNNGPDLLSEYLTPVNTYTEKQVEKSLLNPSIKQNGK